jgi:hypothetical protein
MDNGGNTMSKSIQHLFILATVVLIFFVALFFFIGEGGLMERIRLYIRSDLLAENAKLNTQNKKLIQQLTELRQQNRYLKKVLVGRTFRFSILEQTADDSLSMDATVSQSPSNDLPGESFLNRQIYRALLAEKERWDTYQLTQYQRILDGTLEPIIVDSEFLDFIDNDSRDLFLEVENTLHLHKRLIRDVRLFHDEVVYRDKRIQEGAAYQLYDLKFELEPFARESAITDALQQSLSAMGAGIYQQEAADVLGRLGNVFVEPIQALSEWLENPGDSPGPRPYNYNFYIVFGKKLIDYADTLAEQSLIPLAPSALGELDFFSRRLAQSLVQLHEAGSQGLMDSTILDMEALEREMQ